MGVGFFGSVSKDLSFLRLREKGSVLKRTRSRSNRTAMTDLHSRKRGGENRGALGFLREWPAPNYAVGDKNQSSRSK